MYKSLNDEEKKDGRVTGITLQGSVEDEGDKRKNDVLAAMIRRWFFPVF